MLADSRAGAPPATGAPAAGRAVCVDYYRYHGLGNDYLVIDPRETATPITPAAVRLICDRHFGLGSDGILLGPLFLDPDQPHRASVRIFNPDGGEAEKSGNGTRIFARYLVDAHDQSVGQRFVIGTAGGPVSALVSDPRHRIEMGMGTVSFHSTAVGMAGPDREVVSESLAVKGRPFAITAASIGNPHCVVPVPRATAALAQELGPAIESHPAFRQRTNVQLLEVIGRASIRIEIWERGAGYTLASGSSASAAAAAAVRLGLADRQLKVHMPGGSLQVAVAPDWSVTLVGPVEAVGSGYWAPDFLDRLAAAG